jgi:hypothetical protein
VDTSQGNVPRGSQDQSDRQSYALQILADYYQTGDDCDRGLWHEYARAFRNLAAVRWSPGLRIALLGVLAEPSCSDKDLPTDEIHGELIAALTSSSWSRVRHSEAEHLLLVLAERADAAALADAIQILLA